MKEGTVKYTKDGLTVLWKPKLCIHSARCWKGLPEVFDPKKRKWINIDGTSSEKITAQVKQCPSRALSIEDNLKNKTMENSNVKITVNPNGPLMIEGNITVISVTAGRK